MTRIIKLNHIKYDGTLSDKHYYFKTTDEEVKEGSLVICDTSGGVSLGKVSEIYSTIDEAIKVKDLPYICSLKGCRVFNNA